MNSNIVNWTWHKYSEPAAGWDGYFEDADGNVQLWVATDGTIVPYDQILGSDDDTDESPPYGNLSWLLD